MSLDILSKGFFIFANPTMAFCPYYNRLLTCQHISIRYTWKSINNYQLLQVSSKWRDNSDEWESEDTTEVGLHRRNVVATKPAHMPQLIKQATRCQSLQTSNYSLLQPTNEDCLGNAWEFLPSSVNWLL